MGLVIIELEVEPTIVNSSVLGYGKSLSFLERKREREKDEVVACVFGLGSLMMKRRVVFVGIHVMMLGWIVGVGPLYFAMVETHGGHRFCLGRKERSVN